MHPLAFYSVRRIAFLVPLFSLAIISGCLAEENDVFHSDHVITLTEDNFDSVTSSGSWLLKFYAPWCGHCKSLAPVFDRVARSVEEPVKLGKIDCTSQQKLARRFGIKGYPTLKFFRDGEMRDYKGSRSYQEMLGFCEKMSLPAVKKVDQASLSSATANSRVSFLFVGNSGKSQESFDLVARKFQGLANFLQTEDESLIEKFSSNIDRPVVVLLSEGLQNEIYNENPFDRESLEDWVAQRRFPLVSEIDVSTFEELASSGSPTVVGVVEQMSEKDFSAYLNMLREIALQFRGRYTFGYLYASHWTQWLARMEVPENSYPTVLVMNILQERHYLPDSRFHFVRDHSGIVQFLEDVSQGKVAAKGPSFWSPSRIMRRVDDWLTDNFTDTQIIIGISSILGIFTLLILWGMCSAVGVEAETSPVKVSSPSTEPISSQPIQKKKRKAE